MGCLVVLTGFIAGIWGVATIITFVEGAVGAKVLSLVIEVILVALFVRCLIKYRSPENQEQMKQARERAEKERASAAERAQLRKKFQAEEQAPKREAERLRTTIVATKLLGEGAAEYKKSVGSMAARGAVGSLFGPTGAVIGMATTKSKNTNKNVRRFLVKYMDGHVEEKEATIGSKQYEIYMSFLEWDS